MGKRSFKITLGVLGAALVAGGILLGLNMSGSSNSGTNPSTAANHGSGSEASAANSPAGGAAVDSNSSGSGSGSTTAAGGHAGGASTTTTLPVRVPGICTVVAGQRAGTVVLSSCSQVTATGGSGTFPASLLAKSGTGVITWHGTGTTTFVYTVSHPASQVHKCSGRGIETTLRGAVVANHPIGAGNVGVKGPVRAKLCTDAFGRITLLRGRRFQF